jgi:protein transport protein SEC24
MQRAELRYSVVEFVAPTEYMVRPPQPLVYLFLIDVSLSAVTSGLVATTTRTILESLNRIPNKDGRCKVGFIGVDSSLHYFSVSPGATEPKMLVVGDVEDTFLPQPQDLLLNVNECREGIEALLTRFNDMFAANQNGNNAMGAALKAAHKLISPIGGKIVCLMASLPNMSTGKLTPRDSAGGSGGGKESSLLQAQNTFYKSFAVECSKHQVSVDMFLFSAHYQDVASLSCLPRYTGGQTFYYPGWNASRSEDAVKFANEFSMYLSMEIALEAVMRIRATSGISPTLSDCLLIVRPSHGDLLWKLFQSFLGFVRFPCLPSRSRVCRRSRH